LVGVYIWRFLQETPKIPLTILTVLVLLAVFAPWVAPHDKLKPVKPSAEDCIAWFGIEKCPYIDDRPPFWGKEVRTAPNPLGGAPRIKVKEGRFNVVLGTDYLGRDILSRLIYGARISLMVADRHPGRRRHWYRSRDSSGLPWRMVGPHHHAHN
tara:strand:+ start:135 stop:596 length:462 start_codon:yes stop_codon:yes gene_type:complete